MAILILPMHEEDIITVANIHAEQFKRRLDSLLWVSSSFAARPRTMLFVARNEKDEVIGYIQWLYKSGFRKHSVIELEQLAVTTAWQNQGVGAQLITESFKMVKSMTTDANRSIKSIIVSTRADNHAMELYKKTLGVEPICTVQGLFSGD